MLIPTGFWSYTTSDDTISRGKLSQLRALLAAELQQQVGRAPKVNIFQDVAAIPPGAEWERQIKAAIDKASFLIPIVTPGFLQSEWCCQEVTLFREREAELGAHYLVFPIHYVDCENIEVADKQQCLDPDVLTFLRKRQWTDFRHLRFRSQESEEVSIALENLAKGILKTLREAGIARRRADSARQKEKEEFARAAEAQMRHDAARKARAHSERIYVETILPDSSAQQRGIAEAAQREAKSEAGNRAKESQPLRTRQLHTFVIGTVFALTTLVFSIAIWHHRPWERQANVSAAAEVGPQADVELLEHAATSGSAQAMHDLGDLYFDGIAVQQDFALARKWYEKAAAAGQVDAMNSLGLIYGTGKGVPLNYIKARHWYAQAAGLGHAGAMNNLGVLYMNGLEVRRDYTWARQWFEKAVASGDPNGAYNLGLLYENGTGVTRDYGRAREQYEKAAADGNIDAMRRLAKILANGHGGAKDEVEAKKWLDKAAEFSSH